MADCQNKSQAYFEKQLHALTINLFNKHEAEENAVRQAMLFEKYEKQIKNLFCSGIKFEYSGKVWSVDNKGEPNKFVLRIGSFRETVPIPFFYNFSFNKGSDFFERLGNISKGENVTFRFSFTDNIIAPSIKATSFVKRNPDTGNLAYMLSISLDSIYVNN